LADLIVVLAGKLRAVMRAPNDTLAHAQRMAARRFEDCDEG
jgi:hypothetical protein